MWTQGVHRWTVTATHISRNDRHCGPRCWCQMIMDSFRGESKFHPQPIFCPTSAFASDTTQKSLVPQTHNKTQQRNKLRWTLSGLEALITANVRAKLYSICTKTFGCSLASYLLVMYIKGKQLQTLFVDLKCYIISDFLSLTKKKKKKFMCYSWKVALKYSSNGQYTLLYMCKNIFKN